MASPQAFSTNTGIGVLPEFNQKENPALYAESLKLRSAIRILQEAIDLYTGNSVNDPDVWNSIPPYQSIQLYNLSTIYALASVDINVGQIVNFHDVSDVLNARLADASAAATVGRAFCSKSVLTGEWGEFKLMGVSPFYSVGTFAPGITLYLSETAGNITITPPATSGAIKQIVGYAVATNQLYFNPSLYFTVNP